MNNIEINPDKLKQQAIELCVKEGWREKGEGLNDFNEFGTTALEEAMCPVTIKPNELRLLLEAGAIPDHHLECEDIAESDPGRTALFWLLAACNRAWEDNYNFEELYESIRIMLEYGADPNYHSPSSEVTVFEDAIDEYWYDISIGEFSCRHPKVKEYASEFEKLYELSDKTIRSDLEIYETLIKKYNLPSIEHLWIVYRFMEQHDKI